MPLTYETTDTEMCTAVKALTNVNDVRCARVGPDTEGGYRWDVTFVADGGDIPPLRVASLEGFRAKWTGNDGQARRSVSGDIFC